MKGAKKIGVWSNTVSNAEATRKTDSRNHFSGLWPQAARLTLPSEKSPKRCVPLCTRRMYRRCERILRIRDADHSNLEAEELASLLLKILQRKNPVCKEPAIGSEQDPINPNACTKPGWL